MFGFRYMKASPTQHVLHYSSGRLKREGRALAFFYYAPRSRLLAVPVASSDVPFVVNEATADFQNVAVQGQITYCITEPARAASVLEFEVDSQGKPLGEGVKTLRQRLVNAAHVSLQRAVGKLALRDAMAQRDTLAPPIVEELRSVPAITQMGVQVLNIDILAVTASPEMAKALEAETREALQKRADESIYERRNAAVNQERLIKENELRTEVAVEEKRRQIRETRIAADIAVEQQRTSLVDVKTRNDRAEADTRAYGLDASLKPLKDVNWKTLLVATGAHGDPRSMIALAFQELAENAQKIGELNISPDLLRGLLAAEKPQA